jgi:hypothetical protein
MHPSSQHFVSIQTKTSFYRGDGSGKDMYILSDSGGFRKGGNLTPRGFDYRDSSRSNRNGGRLDGKTLFYHSDGTGRDNYITSNAGGFTRFSGGHDYKNTLRTYNKMKSPIKNNKDYFGWAQVVNRARERAEEKQKDFVVKDVVSRLSPPKYRPDLSLGNETSLNGKPKFNLNLETSLSPMNKSKSPLGLTGNQSLTSRDKQTLTLMTEETPRSKPKFILKTDYTPVVTNSKMAFTNDYDDTGYIRSSRTPRMRDVKKKIYS